MRNGSKNEYLKLINDVREYYSSCVPDIKNVKGKDGLFDLVWCNDLQEEINIWNYWQGRGQEKVNIMIVGQDFGAYDGSDADSACRQIVLSPLSKREEASKQYIKMIKNSKSPTDSTLIKLTQECLGLSYSAEIPSNPNLYFTNLCLGYRTGRILSGGDVYTHLKHDAIYLKRLIKIKRPEIVICLGADTFLAALTGLVEDETERFKDYFKQIDVDFWSLLDDKENKQKFVLNGREVLVFGVSHTGSNGMINRKRLSQKYRDSRMKSIELMKMDWTEIAKYIRFDYSKLEKASEMVNAQKRI